MTFAVQLYPTISSSRKWFVGVENMMLKAQGVFLKVNAHVNVTWVPLTACCTSLSSVASSQCFYGEFRSWADESVLCQCKVYMCCWGGLMVLSVGREVGLAAGAAVHLLCIVILSRIRPFWKSKGSSGCYGEC